MKMKVILNEDVNNLGAKGEVVKVADGYARNYLIPRDLAEEATPSALKRWERVQKERENKKKKDIVHANKQKEKLEGITLELKVKAGEKGRLFGSVTTKDLSKALADQGFIIDRRKISLQENIKELGLHTVPVKLHPEVKVSLEVKVDAL